MKLLLGSDPISLKGSDITLLFLHGFTGTPYEFRDFAAYFNKLGFSIRVPLIAGHGTHPQDLEKTNWKQWNASAKNELFDIRKNKKSGKVIAIGQSMGGTLALHLAAHYQLDGIVLLSPGLIFKNKFTFLANFLSPIKRTIKKNGADISDEEEKRKIVTYKNIPMVSVAELAKLFKHVADDLEDVYCPALIFHSKLDHTIDPKSSNIIYEKISSQNKRTLCLEKSYHILSLDVEKEIIKKEIYSFLSNF